MLNINRLVTFLVPKEPLFVQLFSQAAHNVTEAARVLVKLTQAQSAAEALPLIESIHALEKRGDELNHEIHLQLRSKFIVPFDREDIHYLSTVLDDVIDLIEACAAKIKLYKLETAPKYLQPLAEILLQQCTEVQNAIAGLEKINNVSRIREAIIRINSLENTADEVFDQAVSQLFETGSNASEIMKHKEILSTIETATDKCEDAANVIETIIIKIH